MKKHLSLLFAFLLLASLGAGFSARAEDAEDRAAEKAVEKTVKTSPENAMEDAGESTETKETADGAKTENTENEETPPPEIDFVSIESAGTMSNVREGALGKGLWKDQKRSDILALLENLPARHKMLSLQRLKKNLLLSVTSADLIENDIPPKEGEDLLTIRLQKLIESGLYDEAYDLYTQNVDDPYHDALARIGILLIIYNGELPTACLEEKVLSKRYGQGAFWNLLRESCHQELGAEPQTGETAEAEDTFRDSPVLKASYSAEGYAIPSQDQKTLMAMSLLERAILFARHQVTYDSFTIEPAALSEIPSPLLTLFIKDETLPESLFSPLQKEAAARGLVSPEILRKSDENYEKIRDMEPGPEQWSALEDILSTESSFPSLVVLSPYIDLILDNQPDDIAQDTLLEIVTLMLLNDIRVPPFWIRKMEEAAPENPKNYVYLQTLKALGNSDVKGTISPKKLTEGLEALKVGDAEQVLAIIETLDKKSVFDHNPEKFYGNNSALTLDGYYVMPSIGLTKQIETAKKEQQTGLVVLMLLNVLHDKPERIYPETLRETLEGLQAVGLIEDARKVAKESLARIIQNNNKGE